MGDSAARNRGRSRSRSNVLEAFKDKMRNNWKRDVTCQRRCKPICKCQRYFVHTPAVEEWMQQYDNDPQYTNADRLLWEIRAKIEDHRTFTPTSRSLLQENRCILVFSLLLEQDRGELVDIFQEAQIIDAYLHLPIPAHVNSLRNKLAEKGIRNIPSIIEDFEKAKWAFCSPTLAFHMSRAFTDEAVLPFCRFVAVNEKGGTASVFAASVQRDLIRDDAMALALEKSLYKDEQYGWCYRMAIKSYAKEARDIYEWEKDAFEGLKDNDSMPIVRYLGRYTFDNGIDGSSHNLLLEYGALDLEEYWGTGARIPPVRSEEILRFWKSLFKIAQAIKMVHQVCVNRGKDKQYYDGWHADIKPDNILIVNGEFKLADFGFAKFVKRAENVRTAPEQYIEGGTDTYGAPEFARAKSLGTRTPVRQTIDTWSFGCVLSVAATWIVLGYQGIQQYSKLRSLSCSEQGQQGEGVIDRFHDGEKVLNEIEDWHDFLKDHIRIGDTITPEVLDLIEKYMLLKEPDRRLKSPELCNKLDRLLIKAEAVLDSKITTEGSIREVSDSVKKALLTVEREAALTNGKEWKDTQLKPTTRQAHIHIETSISGPTGKSSALNLPAGPFGQTSKRIGKAAAMKSIPLAQAPHRAEILEEELKKKNIVVNVQWNDKHGNFTESPVEDKTNEAEHALSQLESRSGAERPRTPRPSSREVQASRPGRIQTPPGSRRQSPAPKPAAAPLLIPPAADNNTLLGGSGTKSRADGAASSIRDITKNPEINIVAPEEKVGSPKEGAHQSTHLIDNNASTDGSLRRVEEKPSPQSDAVVASPPGLPPQHDFRKLIDPLHTPSTPTDTKALPSDSSASNRDDIVESLDKALSERQKGKQPVREQNTYSEAPEAIIPSPSLESLPQSVYGLRWDVCKVRETLEARKPQSYVQKGLARIKPWMKGEYYEALKGFINKREMVLVIDNGPTLADFWPILAFVAETLATQLIGLDEDGIDARFTINPERFDKFKLKGLGGIDDLRKLLKEARPKVPVNDQLKHSTDMDDTLNKIFIEYENNRKKRVNPTTLIVLSDGVWEGSHPRDDIDKTILAFAEKLRRRQLAHEHGPRHFTISFIRFGNKEIERLDFFDNKLLQQKSLPDIIDHVSWKASVFKMLVGSSNPEHDSRDEDSDASTAPYEPDQLYKMVEAFNEGLAPPPQLTRRSSQSSRHLRESISRTGTGLSVASARPGGESKRRSIFGNNAFRG